MKKVLMIIVAAAIMLSSSAAMAKEEAECTSEMLRAMGENLFTAPDPGDTSISDSPVADYWTG